MIKNLKLPDDVAEQLANRDDGVRFALAAIRAALKRERRESQALETLTLFNEIAAKAAENGAALTPPLSRAEMYAERGP